MGSLVSDVAREYDFEVLERGLDIDEIVGEKPYFVVYMEKFSPRPEVVFGNLQKVKCDERFQKVGIGGLYVDVIEHPEVISGHNIERIPYIEFYNKGEVVKKLTGYVGGRSALDSIDESLSGPDEVETTPEAVEISANRFDWFTRGIDYFLRR